VSWRRVAFAAGAAILGAAPLAAAADYRAPRTVYGAPDLQGVWSDLSMTRLQRPKEFKTLVVTPAEAAAFEASRKKKVDAEYAPAAPGDAAPPVSDDVGQEGEWPDRLAGLARIGGQIRTSWLVEPADGQLPYTEAARREAQAAQYADDHVFDNPESRPFDERCVLGVGGTAGPPLLNSGSNTHLQIVQTRDHVVIMAEMIHDARIVRLRDRRHAPAPIRPWMGDSIGWWEGDTLVVETVSFNPGERWHWNAGTYVLIAPGAKITERFTRTGPRQILYKFRVEDSVNYTQPWQGEMPLKAAAGPIYEYACHEGNYALGNILAGARAAERAAAKK
jgi:hypothetical protein